MSLAQLRFVHGTFLTQVCAKLGITPTRAHKDAIKAMLKKARGIDSLGDLDNSGLRLFIEGSAILLASEFAIVVSFPGEEDNLEEKDMREFLKLYLNSNDRTARTTNEDSEPKEGIHE